MKKIYTKPLLDITSFSSGDVISLSGGGLQTDKFNKKVYGENINKITLNF